MKISEVLGLLGNELITNGDGEVSYVERRYTQKRTDVRVASVLTFVIDAKDMPHPTTFRIQRNKR